MNKAPQWSALFILWNGVLDYSGFVCPAHISFALS